MMRSLPKYLAFAFILVTLSRVAFLVSIHFRAGWQGWAFAIGLALGVYVTAYFLRFEATFWPAVAGLVFFVLVDLWFNEVELILTLSAESTISSSANFLGMGSDGLGKMYQVSALIYGAFPTVAAALLGWLQAWAEKVASLKSRSFLPRFQVAIAARFDSLFPVSEEKRQITGAVQPLLPESAAIEITGNTVRWDALSQTEKVEISGKTPGYIVSRYGGSERRARMWKQWSKEGKL